MPLAPPPVDAGYSSLDELMTAINAHSKTEGYAITKRRTKHGKNGVNKAVLCCDRGRTYQERIPLEFKSRSTGSRQTRCPFAAHAKLDSLNWVLTVQNETHNHEPSMHPSAHPIHRTVSAPLRQAIAQQSAAGAVPRQIESALRLANPELTITRKDIVNVRQAIRNDGLGPDSPVQALLRQLQPPHWIQEVIVDSQSRLRSLFFAHSSSIELFRCHPEIVLLDCTYKTNRFGLPLLSIVGVNALGKSFIIAFAFLQDETELRFTWAMECLLKMFRQSAGRYMDGPEVFVSDRDQGLMNAIRKIYPRTPHLLCSWHINKCVVAKSKLYFVDGDVWTKFYEDWQYVGQQKTPDEFTAAWTQFRSKWDPLEKGQSIMYPDADWESPAPSADGVDYLERTWIIYKRRWARPWTDKVRHFGNRATSIVEGSHAILKKYLKVSTGDLKTVTDNIQLMLIAQHSSYVADLSGAALRVPFEVKIPPFAVLRRFVTPQALRKILVHYNQMSKTNPLPPCTGVFTQIWGLPCGHALRPSIDSERALDLSTVHSHWHFRPLEQPSNVLLYETELFVQDPPITRPRGRPSQNATLAAASRQAVGEIQRQVASQIQREAANSTRRNPSDFELVERISSRVLRGRTIGPIQEERQSRALEE